MEEALAAMKTRRRRSSLRRAFTLVELLVVISVIAVLAGLLLPILSRGKQKAQGTYCLNNGKQLMIAMTLYTSDYHDFFPPNPDDANSIPGHNWCSGHAGKGGAAEFDPDILKDQTISLLIAYAKDISVFHCPGDIRSGLYQGSDPALIGKAVGAARTFSMNQAVGTICEGYDSAVQRPGHTTSVHSGFSDLSVNGLWLDNGRSNRRDAPWMTYGKLSTVQAPGPEDAVGAGR